MVKHEISRKSDRVVLSRNGEFSIRLACASLFGARCLGRVGIKVIAAKFFRQVTAAHRRNDVGVFCFDSGFVSFRARCRPQWACERLAGGVCALALSVGHRVVVEFFRDCLFELSRQKQFLFKFFALSLCLNLSEPAQFDLSQLSQPQRLVV